MDDNLVWALISPRSAIHVAELRSEPWVADRPEGARSWWLRFPCMGGPERSATAVEYYSPDLGEISTEEMQRAADQAGSRGMYCMKSYCEEQRRKRRDEGEDMGNTVTNNNYEDDGWAIEAWQVMVTICVLVALICVSGLIWHAVDVSRADNVAHEKTLRVKYATCAHDDNPRLCLQKVQE